MDPIGLTRASSIAPIAAVLARVGAPVERLLVKAGVPEWVLSVTETLIPTSCTARLLTHAARAEGIDHLGLLAGRDIDLESLGVFGRLICCSRTLREALEATVCNHSTFSSTGRTWLVDHGDEIELCQAFANRFDEAWRHASHYTLMTMLAVIRLGAGPSWRPARVSLQTRESAALRDFECFSDTHLSFAQPATSITLPRALLDLPLQPSKRALRLPDRTLAAWRASAPPTDFAASVEQVVETLLAQGYPDIHVTADILGTSVRTLQRNLAAAGMTHEALIGRARFTTATGMLQDTDTKIIDIALDLGYSDHAHFTRAFRRWAGCSPQEFRRQRRERGGGSKPAAR